MSIVLCTYARVCKVFGTKFVTPFSNASYIALRWSAFDFDSFFYSHCEAISRLWREEEC